MFRPRRPSSAETDRIQIWTHIDSGYSPLHLATGQGWTQAVLDMARCGDDKAIIAGVLSTLLREAAADGHLPTVKAILNVGCPVDIVDNNGRSVLHYAALGGNVEVIREVLRKGCKINATNNDGMIPLHLAASKGNTKAVLELIRLGADRAKIADAYGCPLHQAAASGHVSTIKAMLKEGCPVDAMDSNGSSVLHFAAKHGSVEVIRALLSNNECDINAMNIDGEAPLHVAAYQGKTEAALELIRFGAKKVIVAGEFGTPLHQAAQRGYVAIVRALLKEGCPLDVVDSKGRSVLHRAAKYGYVEVIRELMSFKECDVNATDSDGDTPLHTAAYEGQTEAVLELIRFGAKKAIVAGIIGTPLHNAAWGGCVTTVKAMIKAGCPVGVVNSKGESVLHYAARGGNAEVVREVLSTGCDINARATNGVTPLHAAAVEEKTKAALELIRQGAEKAIVAGQIGTPLHQAVACGNMSTVKAMVKDGCPVDAVDCNGRSVLHCAAQNGHDGVIVELLSKGCDVNTTDNCGDTPLDIAAVSGNEKAVLELVRHGADKARIGGFFGGSVLAAAAGGHWSIVKMMLKEGFPVNGVTEDGKTIIHLLSMGGEVQLLHLLVERNFSIAQRDIYGLTPLHYAVYFDHVDCCKALLKLGANARVDSPLLGTPLNAARLFSREMLSTTEPLIIRRPDELIVDFALCKELGIKIESPHIFSKHGSTISMFEKILFFTTADTNKVRVPNKLKKILTVFSRYQLVNLNELACLAAINGDVLVLECLSEILIAPTEPGQFYHQLKQLFPVQFKQTETLLQQILPECELNPLQLAIIAMRCTRNLYHVCMYRSSRMYDEVINALTSSDSFSHFLNDPLPNGLSPLDLAEQLGLDKAVTIITRAGGRHGIWAEIPQEVNKEHGSAILQIYQELNCLLSTGSLGQQAVQAVLSRLQGKITTAEQGISTEESHLYQQKVLNCRPDLPVIVRVVLPKVDFRNWEEVGIRLGVPTSTLAYLEHDQFQLRDKYRKMLSYWLEHNDAASWGMLLEVLGHYETKHTMDQLTQAVLATEESQVQPISATQSIPFHHCPVGDGAATTHPPSSQLSPQFVSQVVHHVGVNWYNFALYLGVSSTILDVVKANRRSQTNGCCRESLHRWLRHDRDTGAKARDVGMVLMAVGKACGPVAVERIQSSLQGGVAAACPTPLLQSTPELAKLQEHVVPYAAAQWEAVADYLLVSYETRAAIATSEQGQAAVCCRELFNQWLQKLPGTESLPRTWGVVLDVVGEAVGPEVSKQIRTRLDCKEGGTSGNALLSDPLRDDFLSSKPTAVPLLKKVVPAVASEWLQIGVHLGMEVVILKTFKATESHDLKLCCLEMFESWLKESRGTGESPRTWSSVLSATEDCLGRDVADSIEGALLEERRQRK